MKLIHPPPTPTMHFVLGSTYTIALFGHSHTCFCTLTNFKMFAQYYLHSTVLLWSMHCTVFIIIIHVSGLIYTHHAICTVFFPMPYKPFAYATCTFLQPYLSVSLLFSILDFWLDANCISFALYLYSVR